MATAAIKRDDLVDTLLRHQVFLQRLSASERDAFLPFLKEIDRELRQRLGGQELTQYSRERFEKLLAAVDAMIDEIMNRFQGRLFSELDDIAKNEAAFSARAIGNALDFEAVVPAVSQIRAAVLRNPLSIKDAPLLRPFVRDWSAAERKAIGGAIRRGVFMGQTNAQIVQAIRGTKAARYTDGLLQVTQRHAATVVHTAIQHASSQARHATMLENAEVIKGVQWVSTLDSRTCQVCRSLDRRTFATDKGPRPPIHPSCRCTYIFVLDDEFAALNKWTGTRASAGAKGGQQVAGDLSYYEWLKRQPRAFVMQALGPSRGKLFLDGGISAERFAAMQLDRQWLPLTLAEMRKLEPLAFIRAGIDQ